SGPLTQRRAELQQRVGVRFFNLPSHDPASASRRNCNHVNARVVSPLIHSRYFSNPASTGSASSSGTLYGCSSLNAARRDSKRAERVLSITTTSRSSATLPCHR